MDTLHTSRPRRQPRTLPPRQRPPAWRPSARAAREPEHRARRRGAPSSRKAVSR